MHLCLVTCAYDTDFEPITEQLSSKLLQIRKDFEHFTLLVMNDAADQHRFAEAIREIDAPEVILHNVDISQKCKWGRKGLALREGLRIGLRLDADYYAYINLNLKVDARFIQSGIEAMRKNEWEAALGSRDPKDGGQRRGAGALGQLKSLVFGQCAHKLLPTLGALNDTNAPVKIFSPRSAQLIVNLAQSESAFFDCEWILILIENNIRTGTFPIVWTQRAGSRPPWRLVKQSVEELHQIQIRWRRGLYQQ